MSSKKEIERAVQAFEGVRALICGGNHKSDVAFNQLTDLVGKYIGYNSEQYAQLKNRNVVDNFYTLNQVEGRQAFYKFDEAKTRATIDMYIGYIQANGVVVKTPKGNFLSRMSFNEAMVFVGTVFAVSGGIGFYSGEYFAKNKIEADRIKDKRTIDSLKSIRIPVFVPSSSIPNFKTGTQRTSVDSNDVADKHKSEK